MSNEIKYEIDQIALLDGEEVTVTGYAKGWYEVVDSEGEIRKVRGKQLEPAEDEGKRNMSEILRKYRAGYVKSTSYTGRTTQNTGDKLAEILQPYSPKQVIAIAESALGLGSGELWGRYEHLNPGQQRMNAGNRLRAKLKSEELMIEDVVKALKAIGTPAAKELTESGAKEGAE